MRKYDKNKKYESDRKYYLKNKEKIRKYKKQYAIKYREKRNALERKDRKDNPEKNRKRWLKRRHNITLEQYNFMFEQQGGVCAICGLPETGRVLAVDHNHKTGKIRQLLCNRCNFALGIVENEEFTKKALDYLKRNG